MQTVFFKWLLNCTKMQLMHSLAVLDWSTYITHPTNSLESFSFKMVLHSLLANSFTPSQAYTEFLMNKFLIN